MRIGGFVPVSLCDYPCRVAAVVFTQGCNFRCPFCHNGHLVGCEGAALLDEAAVLAQLAERRNRLGGVVVTGGEPTLQGDLPQFLHALKQLGLAVKLDTNGSQPDVLQALLADRLVDYVAMDLKAPWARYDRLAGLACDPADGPATGNVDSAWSTAPTIGTAFLDRITLPAAVGAGLILPYGRGELVIPPSGSLLLWNLGAAAGPVLDVHFVWEE